MMETGETDGVEAGCGGRWEIGERIEDDDGEEWKWGRRGAGG